MPFESAPTPENFSPLHPEEHTDVYVRRRQRMVLGGILVLLLMVFTLSNFMRSTTADRLTGRGGVTGTVVNVQGQPTQAEIYVIGTDLIARTNPDGSFALENVPAGQQSIVVVDENSGIEYPVTVSGGETVNLGDIKLVTTQIPEG
ncbi:MAG: hypothetical protein Fur0018_02700 [Anaerolineales bacterium]